MEDLINKISLQIPEILKLNNKDQLAIKLESDLEKYGLNEVLNIVEKMIKENKPRLLTKQEIEKMLNRFNEPNIVIPRAKEVYVDSLKRKIRKLLKQIQLSPSVIDEYEDNMYLMYKTSIADPGLPVGLSATESITQFVTQLTLSSFHSSGTSKISPLDRLDQIINTTKTDSKKLNFVFFNNELFSRNDIEEEKRNIQVLRLSIFVNNYEVETVDEIKSRNDYWYPIYNSLFKNDDINSTYILRLYLDKSTMDFYQVTIEDISIAINISDFSNEENSNYVKTIISPKNDLIIDIYLNDETIFETKTKKLSVDQVIDYSIRTKVFVDQILIPSLNKIIIKGINGVKSFDIANELMPLFFMNEIKLKNNDWKVYLNFKSVIKFGLTEKKLVHFLNLVDIKLKSFKKNKIIVSSATSPIETISKKISDTNNNLSSDIYNYNSIFYGVTDGGDLKDILMRENVDPYITYTDNIHEILKILGEEAVRSFLNFEIAKVIGASPNDFPVSSRHITIFSDWITNLEELTSMTVGKIKKYEEGYNNLATIGKPVDFYQKAAATGSYESTNTVANAICFGTCIPVGTGLPKIIVDQPKVRTLEEIVNPPNTDTIPETKKYIIEENIKEPTITLSSTIIKNIDDSKIEDDTGLMSLNLKSDIMNDVLTLLDDETKNINTVQELNNFEKSCVNDNKKMIKKKVEKKIKMVEFED